MPALESIIWLLFIRCAIELGNIEAAQVDSLDARTSNASYPTHTTTRTIERVATFPNGCYKQRIIEPDLWNNARYFETEQLICPPAVNASTFTMLTEQLQRNNSANHTIHLPPANSSPSVNPATNFMNYPHNVPYVAPAGSYPVPPAAGNPVSTTAQHQQQFDPAVTPHAAVLSKKTVFYDHEKKKSCANSFNIFNYFLVFVPFLFLQ